MRFFLCLFFVMFWPILAFAHQPDGGQCAKNKDDKQRLHCYDLVFKKTIETKTKTTDTGKWVVHVEASKIDDSQNVSLRVVSNETFTARSDLPKKASFHIKCRETRTLLYFHFGGAFMSDNRSFGEITFRKDKEDAFTERLLESSDNSALGWWTSDKSITNIKYLFDTEVLLIRFTPYNASPSIVTFPIRGLREAIKPLAKACNWKP